MKSYTKNSTVTCRSTDESSRTQRTPPAAITADVLRAAAKPDACLQGVRLLR
jgi:hypothetical protein